MTRTGLSEASALPAEVDVALIAEDAMQAAFALIAERLAEVGYPVTGDVAPDEALILDDLFTGFVLTMALNNPTIAELQEVS